MAKTKSTVLATHLNPANDRILWQAELKKNAYYVILLVREKWGKLKVKRFSDPFLGKDYQDHLDYTDIRHGDRLVVHRVRFTNGSHEIYVDSLLKKCPNCHGDGVLTPNGMPAPPQRATVCKPCDKNGNILIPLPPLTVKEPA